MIKRLLLASSLLLILGCDPPDRAEPGDVAAAADVADATSDLGADVLDLASPELPDLAVAPSSDPVSLDDPRIIGWAAAAVSYEAGEAVDPEWMDPTKALGPASGSSTEILCLGRGGAVTLSFDPAITNQAGSDFAVFENSFQATFLELAFVEVSTDGVVFERFDSESLTPDPVGPFGDLDPSLIHGLAGIYMQGLGTPFDLGVLSDHAAVLSGAISLDAIHFVRIVDVVGDGATLDSFGHPIYDPYPTAGSAGFDLDGVAVLGD